MYISCEKAKTRTFLTCTIGRMCQFTWMPGAWCQIFDSSWKCFEIAGTLHCSWKEISTLSFYSQENLFKKPGGKKSKISFLQNVPKINRSTWKHNGANIRRLFRRRVSHIVMSIVVLLSQCSANSRNVLFWSWTTLKNTLGFVSLLLAANHK